MGSGSLSHSLQSFVDFVSACFWIYFGKADAYSGRDHDGAPGASGAPGAPGAYVLLMCDADSSEIRAEERWRRVAARQAAARSWHE